MMKLHQGRMFIGYARSLRQSRCINTVDWLVWYILFTMRRLGIMIEKGNTCMGPNPELPEGSPFVLTWVRHVWLRRASFSASQRSPPEVTDASVGEERESAHGMWQKRVWDMRVKLGNEPSDNKESQLVTFGERFILTGTCSFASCSHFSQWFLKSLLSSQYWVERSFLGKSRMQLKSLVRSFVQRLETPGD